MSFGLLTLGGGMLQSGSTTENHHGAELSTVRQPRKSSPVHPPDTGSLSPRIS